VRTPLLARKAPQVALAAFPWSSYRQLSASLPANGSDGSVLIGGWRQQQRDLDSEIVRSAGLYTPGSSVLVEGLPGGELRIIPGEVRECIRDTGGRVVAEHREALKILADHDPESEYAQR
jgi:hypothetical protein